MDRRGQKTGAGFYDLRRGPEGEPLAGWSRSSSSTIRRQGHHPPRGLGRGDPAAARLPDDQTRGAKILEEGKALRASDIDMVWITGYGCRSIAAGRVLRDTVRLKNVLARMRNGSGRSDGIQALRPPPPQGGAGETFTGAGLT